MQSALDNRGKDHRHIAREALLWSVCLCALLPIPLSFVFLPLAVDLPNGGGVGRLLFIAVFAIQLIWPPVGLGYYLFTRGLHTERPHWFWKCTRAQVALWGYIVFWSLLVYTSFFSPPYQVPGEKAAMDATEKVWKAVCNYAIHHHGRWPANLHVLVKQNMLQSKDLYIPRSKDTKFTATNGDGDFGYCQPGRRFMRWIRRYKHPPAGDFKPTTHRWLVLWTKEPFHPGDYMGAFIEGTSHRADQNVPGPILRMDGCYIYGWQGELNKSDLLKALARQHCVAR